MKKHEDCVRGYHRSSRAWYAKSLKDDTLEVSFGMYHKNGGTSGDMSMKWKNLYGKLCAKLSAFEDSWSVLSLFKDVIDKLGEVDGLLISEEDFVRILDECGFKDITIYENTNKKNEPHKEEMVNVTISKRMALDLGIIK